MRFMSLSNPARKRSSIAKGVMLLGCAVALSACNTANNGTASKTALISPTSGAAQTATVQTANAAPKTAPVAGAAKSNIVADTTSQQGATVAVAQTEAQSGETAQHADLAGQASALAMAPVTDHNAGTELAEPAFSGGIPIPADRGQMQPAMAFAAAKSEASPASLAAEVAFVTPATAPRDIDLLIAKYSDAYDVPERLVRRVVHRESRFNPGARNGPYYGLMQISHPTARGMGYQGAPKGLLDAETNLKYAVRYLSGAYKVAGGDENQAVRFYARGYYYDAKRKGLLRETGLDGSFRKGPTREAAAKIEPAVLQANDAGNTPAASAQSASLPGVATSNVIPAGKPAAQ